MFKSGCLDLKKKKKKSKKHDLLIINRVVLLLIPFGHKINRNFHWDPLQRRKWWHILGWEGVSKSERGGGGVLRLYLIQSSNLETKPSSQNLIRDS